MIMTILTAITAFDSRDVAAFSAPTSEITIKSDSEITLIDTTDTTLQVTFKGAFKIPTSGSSYGIAKEINFYSSDTLQLSFDGSFPLSADASGNITFPAPADYISLKFLQGNDKYLGSTGNDYFSIYDNRGKDVYYGLAGNDYIELGTQGRVTGGGGDGNDLLVSFSVRDRLSGGNGKDAFWVDKGNVIITDFSPTDDLDTIILSKSVYEEKMMDDWLKGNASDLPVTFSVNADGNYTMSNYADHILIVEGIKSARLVQDEDDYFIYDQGTGKLYFDQDGQGGKKPAVLVTLEDQPLLTVDEFGAGLIFAEHFENYRSAWLDTVFVGA
jgi:Ca2+-binding RTX toxin-like protein